MSMERGLFLKHVFGYRTHLSGEHYIDQESNYLPGKAVGIGVGMSSSTKQMRIKIMHIVEKPIFVSLYFFQSF